MHIRHFLSLLVLLTPSAYCLGAESDSMASGIWHTEIEDVGLRAAFEFEIRRDTESGEWRGRWEMLERIAWGDLQSVTVDDLSVVVSLDDRTRFEGVLTSEGTTLEGTMHNPSGESPMTFSKVDNWATQMAARTDAQGGALKSWTYSVPEKLDDGWRVASLSAEEVDDLANLFQKVMDGRYRGLDAVLIARGGDLVVEEYFHFGNRDEIHTLQSVTKSVTSLLLGIAHDQGLIDNLDKPLYEFFASDYPDALWVKDEYPITLRHALTMSAALEWHEDGIPYTDSRNDNLRMNRSGDKYEYVLSRELATGKQPGDEFAYTSGLSILLGGVVLQATGMSIDQYAERTLFKNLGIERYYWGANYGQVHTGGGLYLRARDLLKLGQLVFDQGRWHGEQVISEKWIEESTAFHLPRPAAGEDAGYGYQWWRTLQYFPRGSVPVIYGIGYGSQYLWIFPRLEMVMVVFHHNPRPGEYRHSMDLDEVRETIVPAIASDKLTGFCLFKICF